MITEKACVKCGEIKPLNEFNKGKNSKDGLRGECKSCRSEINKKYNYPISTSVFSQVCTKCGVEQPLENFSRGKRNPLGVRKTCKSCASAYVKTRNFPVSTVVSTLICTVCNKEQPLINFYRNKKNTLGVYTICKSCNKTICKEYQASPASYSSTLSAIGYAQEVLEGPNNTALVKCANEKCQKFYAPTKLEVRNRKAALEGCYSSGTEQRIYCSQHCKDTCELYRTHATVLMKTHAIIAGHYVQYKREVSSEFRKIAFEKRGMLCEKCGNKHYLHVHHIEGVTEAPGLAFDINNVRVYCRDCHIKVHQQPGCSYMDYSCTISKKYTPLFSTEPKTPDLSDAPIIPTTTSAHSPTQTAH